MSVESVKVKIKFLNHEHELHKNLYDSKSGTSVDLYAAIKDKIVLGPLETAKIPTGIAIEIPSGYEVQIRTLSDLAEKHVIRVVNAPGTIDADYRGEIFVLLVNFDERSNVICRGDKIGQMVLSKIDKIIIEDVL